MCEKYNSIWFYLLYLFKQYLKWIIHQSFVSTAPTYGDSRGKAGVRCWTIAFWLSPQCRGSVGVITLGHLPCWDFLLCRVGQRAGLLPSACPHRARLIPGLWKVKIIIPAHPRRWGSSVYKWLVHKWHLYKLLQQYYVNIWLSDQERWTAVVLETYTCTDDPRLPNVTGSATSCANSCNGMRVCVKLFQLNCWWHFDLVLRRAGQLRTSS